MNIEQKDTFYSNFEFFMKKQGLKKSDIEKDAGVSQGYLSRFQAKEDPNNFPSVSFLEYCSRLFGVSMDDLISTKFNRMNDTEEKVYQFILKLINETKDDRIIWKITSCKAIQNIIGHSEGNYYEEFSVKFIYPKKKDGTNMKLEKISFRPADELGSNGFLCDEYYETQIHKDLSVLMIPIEFWDEAQNKGTEELTLWISQKKNYGASKTSCIARGNDEVFQALNPILNQLKATVIDRSAHMQVDKELKDIINWYISPDANNVEPPIKEDVQYGYGNSSGL